MRSDYWYRKNRMLVADTENARHFHAVYIYVTLSVLLLSGHFAVFQEYISQEKLSKIIVKVYFVCACETSMISDVPCVGLKEMNFAGVDTVCDYVSNEGL